MASPTTSPRFAGSRFPLAARVTLVLTFVVILAGIQEHDLREVARLLDLPEGTVKSRMFLARQRLKEQLQWTISDTPRR